MNPRSPQDERERDIERGVEVAATALAAGGATVAGAGVAVLPACLSWAANALFRARANAAERRTRIWLENIAAALDYGTAERVREEFDEHADEPWAREGLLEAFRRLMEALDESALPCVARLSAEYVFNREPPDAFFRSFGRFIQELDADDIAVTQQMLAALKRILVHGAESAGAPETGSRGGVQSGGMLEIVLRRDEEDRKCLAVTYSTVTDAGQEQLVPFGDFEHVLRVFAGLKGTGLAHDGSAGYFDSVAGPHVMAIERATVVRLSRYFE